MDAVLTLGLCLAGIAALPAAVHIGFRAPRIRETGSPADHGLNFEEVRIPTVRGRTLFGWLLPAPDSGRTVVVLHGWGSNAELMLPIAAPLRRAGLNVLLCDARCHGNSDPDTFASLPRFAEDLGKAIDWLRCQHPGQAACVAVLGHSVGAGAALFLASRRADLSAVISIAAFAHPAEVTRRYLQRLRLPWPVTGLVIRYVEWLIGHRFETIAPVNTVRRIACPVLLVHGTDDSTVPIADARRIQASGRDSQVRLLEIPGAGHGSTDQIERHAGRLLEFLAASWAAGPQDADRKGAGPMVSAVRVSDGAL